MTDRPTTSIGDDLDNVAFAFGFSDQAKQAVHALINKAEMRGEKRGIAIAQLDSINRMRAIDGRKPLTVEDVVEQVNNKTEEHHG